MSGNPKWTPASDLKKQIYPNATTMSHLETEKKKHSWPSATGKIKSEAGIAFF